MSKVYHRYVGWVSAIADALSITLIIAGTMYATTTPPPLSIALIAIGGGLHVLARRSRQLDVNGAPDGEVSSSDDDTYRIPIVKVG